MKMTQERPSKLSFSIEETVWLNKGQEVKEILAMSLEPDIRIEEKQDHVYIKGGLRLLGEYVPTEEEATLDPTSAIQEQVSFRSVEEVTIDDEGKGSIQHFFPIDVTIPLNRIQKLDDIYVQVDSFDYDLPERSCIQLTADVSISGMTSEPPVSKQKAQSERPAAIDPLPKPPQLEPIPSTFSFEAKKPFVNEEAGAWNEGVQSRQTFKFQPADNENKLEEDVVVSNEEQAHEGEPIEESKADQAKVEESTASVQKQQEENHHQEVTSVANQDETADGQVNEENAIEPALMRGEVDVEHDDSESVEEEENPTKIQLGVQREEVAIDEESQEDLGEDTDEPKGHREENALYLTKMMTNGEEEFSKLKMCIIQENESLDMIAERYDISTSHLIRFNRLTEERVEEGQILYIPVPSHQSKEG
ncbi:stage VI sporulation protein D [Halalkalibacterium halodurans]|nr:stage VI sporulation protein D [Halalkalibacterium halodurans]